MLEILNSKCILCWGIGEVVFYFADRHLMGANLNYGAPQDSRVAASAGKCGKLLGLAGGKAAGIRRISIALITALSLIGLIAAQAAPPPAQAKKSPEKLPTLTTVRAAHSLTSAEATRGYPVHLRAVVLYYAPRPNTNKDGMWVHDSTGSIYVIVHKSDSKPTPPGTLVEMTAVTNSGAFAPTLNKPTFKVIGHVALPKTSDRPSLAQMMVGGEDGQWIEAEGIVHSAAVYDYYVLLQLAMTDGTLSVGIVKEQGVDYSSLVDAQIRVRGNPHPVMDISHKHMIGVRVESPGLMAVEIVQAAPKDPYNTPAIPISRLLQWDVANLMTHRVHIQGSVTMQWPGSSICIHDAAQGICAQTNQSTRMRNGELVDIVGFVHPDGNAAAMTDAIFRSSGSATVAPVSATPTTADDILKGNHESQLIQIDGQLISRDLASADTTLLINSGKYIFTAVLPAGLSGSETKKWQNGSVLRITGICSVQVDMQKVNMDQGDAAPKSFRVLMRSPADVVVLKKASWWTPVHAVILLSLVLTATLGALVLVLMLRKRLELQTKLLREQADKLHESEERFRHMAMHDALTGLATRVLLQDRMDVAMEAARRRQSGLALLMIDVDKFKDINDTFGHAAGDEVLRVTADRLIEAVRKIDTVARIGGDEFVVLLTDLRDPQVAERIASNIVKNLAVPVSFEGGELPLTASAGVCMESGGELDGEALFRGADAALYQAKASGRNCYRVYTPEMVRGETQNAS